MRRPAATEDTLERIRAWRRRCPDLVLRSTFIVGFPGETDADFEQLLTFLEEAELDRVGCFEYSPVAGAAANALPGTVPDELMAERHARFMATQQAISRRRLARRVGREIAVLVDGREGRKLLARSAADAPDIDGLVYVRTRRQIAPGEFLRVRVERADAYDLHAVPV
jgi:ribosomal protein S12 methylthiotransferase